MARLSNLPLELMRLIIRHITPYDIESLTLSCKRIFDLGYDDLSRHRALKQKPKTWYCGTADSTPPCEATQLLMQMLEDPLAAFYLREISLDDEWLHFPDYADLDTALPEDLQVLYSEGIISRVKESVSRIMPQDEVTDWLHNVQFGAEVPGPSILFPLLLLPLNLLTLDLEFRSHNHWYSYATLCCIMEMKGPGAPLSRLRHAEIHSFSEPMDFKLITLFAALPSIISIRGSGIHTSWTYADPDTKLAPRSSNLRELVLTDSSINANSLIGFLESFKALRSFTYHRLWSEKLNINRKRIFDPYRLCCGLRASAGSTLESLNILSDAEDEDYMGDLRCFENLRHLHTEVQLLLSGPISCCASTCLARALPPKLETLALVCRGAYEECRLATMLLGLAEMKTQCVPALEKVEIFTYYAFDDVWTKKPGFDGVYTKKPGFAYNIVAKACSDQGIDLRHYPK